MKLPETGQKPLRLQIPTPYGAAAVEYTRDGRVTAVLLPPHGKAFPSLPVTPPTAVADLGEAIRTYFAGDPVDFERFLPDLTGKTPFQQEVYARTARIPRGTVMTYSGIAAAVGRPEAARAVGQVMATNPYPVIIPCHRVVATNGHLGGFAGGAALKTAILRMEGVQLL